MISFQPSHPDEHANSAAIRQIHSDLNFKFRPKISHPKINFRWMAERFAFIPSQTACSG